MKQREAAGRASLYGTRAFAATLAERERALGLVPDDAPAVATADESAPMPEVPDEAPPAPLRWVRTFTTGDWNERGEGLESCQVGEAHFSAWAYHPGYSRLLCTRCCALQFRELDGSWAKFN